MRDTLAPDGVFVGIALALLVSIFAREILLGVRALARWSRWRFRRDPVTGVTRHEGERIIRSAFERIGLASERALHRGSRRVLASGVDLASGPDSTSITIRTAAGRVGTWSDVGPVVRIQADSAADALDVFLLGDLTAPPVKP